MNRYSFIMPLILEDRGKGVKGQFPKYLWTGELANCSFYSLQPYAFAGLCLAAADMEEANATIVAGQADVWTIPVDPKAQKGAVDKDQLAYFKAWVTLYKLPTDGLKEGMTYAELVRYFSGSIQTSQILAHQKGFDLSDKALDTRFGDLKAKDKAELDQLYTEKGYSKTKFNNAASVSDVLQVAADAAKDIAVTVGGVDF